MGTENKLRLADVLLSITDPRQASKVEHNLAELLVVAVNGVLVGARGVARSADHSGGHQAASLNCSFFCSASRAMFR